MDILAIDPGLTSGVAHIRIEDGTVTVVQTAELDCRATGLWLKDRLADLFSHLNDVGVVAERFTITPKTGSNTQAPWSLRVIGQCQWILWEADPDRELLLQSPADAKTAFPNDRLRSLGLWHRGGKGHALDALRHAALLAHRAKLLPRTA